MSKFKIDEPIIITRDGGAAGAAKRRKRKKGILDSEFEPDYQARRKKPENGIQFYDLGVLKDEDGNLTDAPLFNYPVRILPDGTYLPTTPADFEPKNRWFIEQNNETYESKFLKITRSENEFYDLTFRSLSGWQSVDDLWNEAGDAIVFEDPDQELSDWIMWRSDPHIFPTYLDDDFEGYDEIRITLVPIYDAPPEERLSGFILSKTAKIFMLPAFTFLNLFWGATLQQPPVSGSNPQGSMLHNLRCEYQTYQRMALREHFRKLHVEFNSFAPLNAIYPNNTLENWIMAEFFRAYAKTLSTARSELVYYNSYTVVQPDGGTITRWRNTRVASSPSGFSAAPAYLFPAPPALPVPYTANYDGARDFRVWQGVVTGSGDLLAVIKQNDTWFWVWAGEDY